jgi:serine/threonine protein kinase/tetratricopeptide (TPR) repeat protein
MTTQQPGLDSLTELDRWALEFERGWRDGEAELDDFLPPDDHPHFDRILCELIRIDLEMRWSRGQRKTLVEYRKAHPRLGANKSLMQEVAYEEYRQRIQAGETVEIGDYRDRFGVDVSQWPSAEATNEVDQARTQVLHREYVVDQFPKTAEVRQAVVSQLRHSSPGDADRIEEAVSELPRIGERVFGFELVEELGEGAFAKVFRARQADLADRPVALKVAAALSDEPRKLARLQHTNIVPIYSVHQGKNLHAVCMPYLGSLTLEHLLQRIRSSPGSLPRSGRELLSTLYDRRSTLIENNSSRGARVTASEPNPHSEAAAPVLELMSRCTHTEAVLWMGIKLADGLAHAHQRGILHLDLKPANILLTDEGEPMLLDFNLSVDMKSGVAEQLARLGGTLPYMSPEQLDAFRGGKRDLDARSDLYSLGIILFEMLTGKSPFEKRIGRVLSVVLGMIDDRRQPVPSVRELNPSVSPAVEAIIRKLLACDRNERYRSAAQVREDFERQLANRPLRYAPNPSLRERIRKWHRRHPRLGAATTVGLLAGVLVLFPATAIAVRQNQIAERAMQIEAAEAAQTWHEAFREARTIQVLLATRSGDRTTLEEGLSQGKEIVRKYQIEPTAAWLEQPLVARLPRDEQHRLRLEFGEMLLFMARGEQIRANDAGGGETREAGLRAALRWNELAAACYPPDQLPAFLLEQRSELISALPPDASIGLAAASSGASEYDAYHTGVAHAMAARYREALALLVPFAEKHPLHYQSWFVRGICHDAVGQDLEAAASWTACIALEPRMPLAHYNRGLSRIRQTDHVRAIQDFTRALELEKDRPSPWLRHESQWNRVKARKALKQYAEALEEVNEVLATPEGAALPRFLLVRAELNDLLNRPEEAKRDRSQAMTLQPRDEMDWSMRGYVRLESEPKAALEDLDAAIALNPRSFDALINKSIVLTESLNRPRDGVAVLDRFLEYYPDHTGARLGRAVTLARLGECKRARRDIEQCLEYDVAPFFLFQAAGAYAQISRHEKGDDARCRPTPTRSS